MLVQQSLLHIAVRWIEHECVPIHESDFLQDHCVMNSFHRIFAPGKGTVRIYQNSRDGSGILVFECFDNYVSGLFFIFTIDFFIGHRPGAGDIPIEVIALCRAHGRNAVPGLREGRCPAGMRMHDAAAFRESAVEFEVSRHIAGRTKFAFDYVSLHVDNHHIVRLHDVIGNAGGLDHKQAFFTVDSADVAPRKRDQFILGQQQICFAYSFF